MLSTTLELPEDLKARIAPLAEAEGKTPHAWMVDALRAQVALADLRQAFVDDARRSASEVDAGGALFAMEDVAASFARAQRRQLSEAARRCRPGQAPEKRVVKADPCRASC